MPKDYIKQHKKDWAYEFAANAQVKFRPEYVSIAEQGAYTMLYEIADSFRDGAHRDEILGMYGIKLTPVDQ
jgi:hypothetical protein